MPSPSPSPTAASFNTDEVRERIADHARALSLCQKLGLAESTAWLRANPPDIPAVETPAPVDASPFAVNLATFVATVPDGPGWLVERLVPDAALTVFGGEPRTCKTFTAMNVLAAVAGNGQVMGLPVLRHGPVLYVGEEGQARAVADRLGRLGLHYMPVHGFSIAFRRGVKLADAEMVARLREHIEATRPLLVVIDTLARVFVGNENDPYDMSRHLDPLEAIIRDFGPAIVLVHHTNKSGTGTAGYQLRGSGALPGAVQGTAIFKSEVSGGLKTTRGTVEVETKDSPPETLHWELDPETFAINGRTASFRPTPEQVGETARALKGLGVDGVTAANLQDRWRAENPSAPAYGRSLWAEIVAETVSAGLLLKTGNGKATRYEPSLVAGTGCEALPPN